MKVMPPGLRACTWLLFFLSACGQPPPPPAPPATAPAVVDAGLPLPPAGRVAPPLRFLDARDSPPLPAADLHKLRQRGVLRMVFLGSPGQRVLPEGHPLAGLMEQAEYLAEYLGLELQPLAVEQPGKLLPLLQQGRAEMVGELLAPVQVPGLDCSTAVDHVRLLLVGRRSDPQAPASLRQALEQGIWVADEPGATELRRRAGKLLRFRANVVAACNVCEITFNHLDAEYPCAMWQAVFHRLRRYLRMTRRRAGLHAVYTDEISARFYA